MSAIHSQCQEIDDSVNINQSCNPEKHRDPYSSFREAPAGKKAPLKRNSGVRGAGRGVKPLPKSIVGVPL